MKKFMKTCYKCKANVKMTKSLKAGVELNCLKCTRCGEEYFTSSELIKYDILTGKRTLVRKFGVIGDSTVMRFPTKILKEYNIKPGDYGVFERRSDGILIKLVKAEEIS
ncbi:MAG: AbrB/MazE/SpoVT family DNA-binding domain-containing protein [Candidatus Woesearchaeota archaeon]